MVMSISVALPRITTVSSRYNAKRPSHDAGFASSAQQGRLKLQHHSPSAHAFWTREGTPSLSVNIPEQAQQPIIDAPEQTHHGGQTQRCPVGVSAFPRPQARSQLSRKAVLPVKRRTGERKLAALQREGAGDR